MKNLIKITKLTSVIFVITVLFSSCASTTIIQSTPSGADVYLNDQKVGKTPYTMNDTKIIFTTTSVKIKKDGYKPFNTIITRNEEADVGPIIGGIFILPIWLWVLKYNPVHKYELEPSK